MNKKQILHLLEQHSPRMPLDLEGRVGFNACRIGLITILSALLPDETSAPISSRSSEEDLAYSAFRAWVSSPDTLVNEDAIPAMWDKINEHGKEGWRRIVRALRKALRDGDGLRLSSYEQP